jgi:hypothetical protein
MHWLEKLKLGVPDQLGLCGCACYTHSIVPVCGMAWVKINRPKH